MRQIHYRPAWLEIDLDAIEGNARILAELVQPAALWVVVKADGYGHGATPVAKAALQGGATGLCVALVEEGIKLRNEGVRAPILVLSEPPLSAVGALVENGLTASVYTPDTILAVAEAAQALNVVASVQIKVDTGMHRVGVAPDGLEELLALAYGYKSLSVASVFTHFANADDPADELTALQADTLVDVVKSTGFTGPIHSANSAAALSRPDLHMSAVRVGLSLYGLRPGAAIDLPDEIEPALSLKAQATFVKVLQAGDRISYGQRYAMPARGQVLTVPVGYADGIPRALGQVGGEVLVNGRRCPIAGNVTMDQLMVDAGNDISVESGTEVVLIGGQGSDYIGAEEWAEKLGTIPYEVVCRFGSRLPRRYIRAGQAVDAVDAEASEDAGQATSFED